MQNFVSESGPPHVTVYFPIAIGICDIFMLLPISIGRYTVNTVQERYVTTWWGPPLFEAAPRRNFALVSREIEINTRGLFLRLR